MKSLCLREIHKFKKIGPNQGQLRNITNNQASYRLGSTGADLDSGAIGVWRYGNFLKSRTQMQRDTFIN